MANTSSPEAFHRELLNLPSHRHNALCMITICHYVRLHALSWYTIAIMLGIVIMWENRSLRASNATKALRESLPMHGDWENILFSNVRRKNYLNACISRIRPILSLCNVSMSILTRPKIDANGPSSGKGYECVRFLAVHIGQRALEGLPSMTITGAGPACCHKQGGWHKMPVICMKCGNPPARVSRCMKCNQLTGRCIICGNEWECWCEIRMARLKG